MVMVVNSAAAMAMKPPGPTKSGLQKQVLTLYKRALRAAQKKDKEHARSTAQQQQEASTAAAEDSNRTFTYVRERFRDDVRTACRLIDTEMLVVDT